MCHPIPSLSAVPLRVFGRSVNWRKKAYRAVDRHTADRLRQWLCRKHKVQGAGTTRYPDRYLYEKLNLVRLEVRRRNFAWAKA